MLKRVLRVPQSHPRPGRTTILHLVQPVEGGVARVVADLVRAHVRQQLRVVVACPPSGWLPREAAAAGAEVEDWPAGRELGLRVARETWAAHRLIRRIRPDVVHAHSAKAGLAARLAVRGRGPTVYQPHAWSFQAVQGRTASMARAWERFGARWSTRLLCVSDAERLCGQRTGVVAPWSVIRNGVDLDHFSAPVRPAHDAGSAGEERCEDEVRRAENTRRAEARAALPALRGVPAGAPLVVCVGRLCAQKGQDVLLDSWGRILARVPGARLALVGDGPDRPRLERRAARSVVFAGATEDVRHWYAAADVVVLPSRWEGMALAPLEAMACGRPVVLTDVSGARESLPPGHHARCLVPPGDPYTLATAVIVLLADPTLRTCLGREAQEHVRTTFDVRCTAAAVLDLYRDLLGAPALKSRE
ncbi:glycosyltransferase [Streptomyces sp. MST-110588]|uniref:glycosyltransferase n=1 Tax=Streptomyces sp. MST-110588 TaxID=2833628 RepID=UPI001F5D7099|nr:glycosyltransferase [Streptomyces sp. MST-110588]UNO43232.1 glycosyltransferase [Streptomyces sp. MST-110588]